ncbi:MAG TPA: hypothetical protein DCP91_03295 [Eggerthellaceae bacterium]|nr:hypothetical protein [Eggerthellaceae bacterium]
MPPLPPPPLPPPPPPPPPTPLPPLLPPATLPIPHRFRPRPRPTTPMCCRVRSGRWTACGPTRPGTACAATVRWP